MRTSVKGCEIDSDLFRLSCLECKEYAANLGGPVVIAVIAEDVQVSAEVFGTRTYGEGEAMVVA